MQRMKNKPLKFARAASCCTLSLMYMTTCAYQAFWDEYVIYVPSRLEVQWNQSIRSVMQSWPRLGCPRMMEDMRSGRTSEELSYHVFFPGNVKVFIEPLIGTLRHPETACFQQVGDTRMLAKWIIIPPTIKGKKHMLFVDGESSRRWVEGLFAERFFDSVLPWKGGSMLHKASKDYYTVAYIDHLDRSMLNETLLSTLDEVFLDHRTYGSPMVKAWGQHVSSSSDISSTYALLASLRHKGVRAHAV